MASVESGNNNNMVSAVSVRQRRSKSAAEQEATVDGRGQAGCGSFLQYWCYACGGLWSTGADHPVGCKKTPEPTGSGEAAVRARKTLKPGSGAWWKFAGGPCAAQVAVFAGALACTADEKVRATFEENNDYTCWLSASRILSVCHFVSL